LKEFSRRREGWRRRSYVRSLRTYVLDTIVLIAYITENATGRERVLSMIEEARRGKVQLYTIYPVLQLKVQIL
jgi:hypothetical protein